MNEFRQTVLNGNNRIEGDETIDAYETLMLDPVKWRPIKISAY